MLRKTLTWSLALAVLLAVGTGIAVYTQEEGVPAIPGVTAEDTHPNGCVDCHRKAGEDRDYRLSTAIEEWATEGAPEELIEWSEAAWPDASLSGQHPGVSGFVASQTLPDNCYNCHGEGSGMPLKPLLHTVHYAGGGENHFVSGYDGRCLQCHTMNTDVDFPYPPTGEVEMKSGREQPDGANDGSE